MDTLKASTVADLDLAPLRKSGTPSFSLSTYTKTHQLRLSQTDKL
jgi:hypothetical protein